MKRPSMMVAVLAVVAGCGGRSDPEPTLSFPVGTLNEAHNFYVPVADKTQAEKLCEASEDWPAEYPDQVTFDLPNTGSDYTCVNP